MAVLHVLNRHAGAEALARLLARTAEGDAVLLMEEAVYALAVATGRDCLARAIAEGRAVYVLEADAKSRGVGGDRWSSGVLGVDHGGFVDLAVRYDHVLSWN